MFEKLIHADWSTSAGKRWMAAAERIPGGWQVASAQPVPPAAAFLDRYLFGERSVLAGFDFPLGLPVAFARKTGFASFPEALAGFGKGEWEHFFTVANAPEDISLERPFYPGGAQAGRSQKQLLAALGIASMAELLRECERKTGNRRAACPVFWTLGANQVGKAAIDGWQTVIRPALLRGARLWPFHGRLGELAKAGGCVLCETYPQEAYGHIGGLFPPGASKRRQEDRRAAGAKMLGFANAQGVRFSHEARKDLDEGFGQAASGEDPFDAMAGLLSMIAVADGRRDEGGPGTEEGAAWEGWILGQPAGGL